MPPRGKLPLASLNRAIQALKRRGDIQAVLAGFRPAARRAELLQSDHVVIDVSNRSYKPETFYTSDPLPHSIVRDSLIEKRRSPDSVAA